MSQRLTIVIVNWNAGTQLRKCLASIATSSCHLPPEARVDQVVVVDNASDDGSADGLALPGISLRVIRNRENRGFAAACNQGAAEAAGDLILFLNPDTRLFADSLAVPLAALQSPEHARSGIVGIQMVDDAGSVARSCARFPTVGHFAAQALGLDRLWPQTAHFMREWDHAHTREVDQVIGAFFLIRQAVFEALGGFDERFFVYFEEVDLAWRARQAGWRCVYLAGAQAYHRGGGTTGQVKARRLFYSLRSRLQYGRKHLALPQRLALHIVTWLVEPLSRTLFLAFRLRWREIGDLAEGYGLLLRDRLARR